MLHRIGLGTLLSVIAFIPFTTESVADTVRVDDGSFFSDLHVSRFDGLKHRLSVEGNGTSVAISASEVNAVEFVSPSAKLTLRDGSTYSSVEVQFFDGTREVFGIWHNQKIVEIPVSEVREIRFPRVAGEAGAIEVVEEVIPPGWADEELYSNLPRGFGLSDGSNAGGENPYMPRWKGQGATKGLGKSGSSKAKKSVTKSPSKTTAAPSKRKRKESSRTREGSRSRSGRDRERGKLDGNTSASTSQRAGGSEGRFGATSGGTGLGGQNGSSSGGFSLGGSW
jgi:hypothetical protein